MLLKCCLALLLLFFCTNYLYASNINYSDFVGTKLKQFSLPDLNNNKVDIAKKKLNKPLLINVWATWCTPCIKEMPSLNTVANKGDFKVIAIATDNKLNKVKNFIKKYNLNDLDVYFDKFGVVSRNFLQVNNMPVTFLIDKEKKVRAFYVGEMKWLETNFYKNLLNKVKIVD